MLQIAVCDDVPAELTRILQHIHRYINEYKLDARVEPFSHPDALLLAAEKTSFDLYLLDIVMPMITGIGVGRELRQRKSTAQLVYLTTSEEFAVSAFSVRAAHYLIKPFTAAEFDEAIDRALENMHRNAPKQLTVRGPDGELRLINVREIEYIECRGHLQEIHLQEIHLQDKILTEQRRSIGRLQEELGVLAPGQFIASYKGFLVNLSAIVSIGQSGISLRSGIRVPISRGTTKQLQAIYAAFRFRKKEGL